MNKRLKQLKKRICAAGMVVAAAGVSVPAAIGALPVESVYAGPPEKDINATNFPDENFRKCISDEYIDSDGNGKVSLYEMRKCWFIGCRDMEINDLTGVDLFENLSYLSCGDNNLKSLDVSKNYSLDKVFCDNNKLSNLDVSKNAGLKQLVCDNNNLSSLDVSSNTALEYLECSNNNLCSLDLSKNTEMYILVCESQERDVKVSNNEITLTDLDPEINADRISNVIGAVLSGGKFTNITGDTVTYDYATGYEDTTMDVTLNIKRPDNRTGLYSVNGQWVYLKKGKQDTTFTGLAKAASGKWYHVTKGKYNPTYTGLSRAASGKWYYVKKGKYDTSFTGLAKAPSGKWYHVTKGKYDSTYTGLSKAASGKWYYVRKGKYDTSYTGLAKAPSGKLYYVTKGKYNTKYNGKAIYNNKQYTVVNGRVK